MDQAVASREELLARISQLEKMVIDQQNIIAEQYKTTTEQHKTISELSATIEELQRQIKELKERLSKGRPKGMPGLKPKSADHSQTKEPRKRRIHGFARLRATPTEQVIHVVEKCPKCGTHLAGGSVKYRREVIELPEPQPVKVTEHVFMERECPLCRERLVPKDVLAGVVVGEQRFGVNVLSLISTLREELRLPVRAIQQYLDIFHQLPLSVGGIVGALAQVAEAGQPAMKGILERIRASEVVNADETGWREDGVNGYVWTFCTAAERYFLRRGRNKEVVDEVLGEKFCGVLVTDFYAAYNHYPGLHQRCWAHLLRDIHELKVAHPDDESLRQWAEAVHKLFEEAKGYRNPKERERLQAKQTYEDRLLELCRPFLNDGALQRVLCQRITDFIKELFVFVAIPGVPADNNGAERSLRHLVTSRKISGGTRSANGTDVKMTLASLFGTWRAQNLNPFISCRQLLISPQV